LMPMANRILGAFSQFQRHESAMLVLNRELSSLASPPIARINSQDGVLFQKNISFENVSFSYGECANALSDINFEIEKGEFIGVVGESGSGKSTLVDILLGLLVPTSGHVFADGEAIEDNIIAWRQMIGYVPQTNFILNTTLRRNIAFATPDPAIDDSKVLRAIKLACLDEVLNSLPEGLDTCIGENGQRLSVGQRQRIGIARAIFAKPELIVLDEATSSLDVLTEKEISASISQLRGTNTLIVVAHRLSTLREADRIVFLDRGRVSDYGSFESLCRRNIKFREMVELSQYSPTDNKVIN
jgi:ATP-binding cassette, subfamily B, bacterial PglK